MFLSLSLLYLDAYVDNISFLKTSEIKYLEFKAEESVVANNLNRCFLPLPHDLQKTLFEGLSKDQSIVLASRLGFAVSVSDLKTLFGTSWLNDEIINFYFCLIVDEANKKRGLDYSYCFNSFFYPTLCKRGYEGVKRWTRNMNIFKLKKLILPIHLGNHWCLACIDFQNRIISYYDSLMGENIHALNTIYNYLKSEYKYGFTIAFPPDWMLVHLKVIPLYYVGNSNSEKWI